MNMSLHCQRLIITLLLLVAVAACSPPQPTTPRPTAATIIEITPAATQNVDATATVYAQLLIPTPTAAGLYRVQTGDTLSSLAGEFGTTVEELMAANGLTDPNALQIGQSLIIPSLISSTLELSNTNTLSDTANITATGTLSVTATPTISTP